MPHSIFVLCGYSRKKSIYIDVRLIIIFDMAQLVWTSPRINWRSNTIASNVLS